MMNKVDNIARELRELGCNEQVVELVQDKRSYTDYRKDADLVERINRDVFTYQEIVEYCDKEINSIFAFKSTKEKASRRKERYLDKLEKCKVDIQKILEDDSNDFNRYEDFGLSVYLFMTCTCL